VVGSLGRTNATVCTEEATVDMEEDMGKSLPPLCRSS